MSHDDVLDSPVTTETGLKETNNPGERAAVRPGYRPGKAERAPESRAYFGSPPVWLSVRVPLLRAAAVP